MLLFFETYESQCEVTEWLLYVSEIGFISDDLFAARLVKHLGSQSLAPAVIGHFFKFFIAVLTVTI